MKEKKRYVDPEAVFYPVFREDILTTSDLPTLAGNETPLIFY